MKYTDLLVYVLTEVPSCPEFTAERAIRDTCIDFCARTDLYRAEPQQLTVSAGITEYEIDAPTGTEPNHVKGLYRAGKALEAVTFEDCFMRIELSDRNPPAYFTQYDNKNIMVGPKPETRETLKILYTLKPTQTSTSIPDTIGLEHRETLVSGALFRLQMMGGQPWMDGAAAGANRQLYERGVVTAMRQAKYGHSGAALSVTPREFI